MVVPVQQAGGSMERYVVKSSTSNSKLEGMREDGGEQEVKEQRRSEMDCRSG